MQTIVLYLCYIVLILLFSTAYHTSLIYCFVIWCLHTNKRRPCSSTLSGRFISHLARWLCTRRFSEPTFRPSGATNHWKNSVSRLSYLFAHLHLLSSDSFSSLIFSLLLFSSLTLPTSAFPSVHIVGSLTSKLPSIHGITPLREFSVMKRFWKVPDVFLGSFGGFSPSRVSWKQP